MKHKVEKEIIQDILRGDVIQFSILVERYQHYVYSIAYKIVANQEDAKDIAQESFLKAFTSLASFSFQSKFSTWLYRITVNTAISKRRKNNFVVGSEVTVDSSQPETVTKKILQNEQKDFIQRAFQSLPEDDVILLTLFYLEELHIKEIAEILDWNQNKVKVALFRARKKCYRSMKELLKEEANELL